MRRILILLCAFQINASFAQHEPIDLARQLLSVNGVLDTANFYSEELDLRPEGITGLVMSRSEGYQSKENFLPDFSALISKYRFNFRSFPLHADHQIINVTATDTLVNGFDFYLHFKKRDNHWQLAKIERLERSVVAHLYYVEMYSEHQVDSIINSDDPYKIIQSKEAYNYAKQVHDLALSFDDTIIDYFIQNKSTFHELKDAFFVLKREGKKIRQVDLLHKGIALSSIRENHRNLNDCLAFLVCHNEHSSVGYFYAANKSSVQSIYSKDVYFVREIGDGWYMFKGKGR